MKQNQFYRNASESEERKISLHQHSIDKKNDLSLWSSFRDGDESAFVNIYNDYYDQLFNFGIQITSDQELIKDCIQDFFIDLRKSRNKLADVRSLKVYLIVSFRRRLIKYLSLQNKTSLRNLEITKECFEVILSTEDKIIDAQFKEEQLKDLEKSMNKLSPREREAIYYFYYQNLGYREISQLFNYGDVKTARNLIYGALSKLKKHLLLWLILLYI